MYANASIRFHTELKDILKIATNIRPVLGYHQMSVGPAANIPFQNRREEEMRICTITTEISNVSDLCTDLRNGSEEKSGLLHMIQVCGGKNRKTPVFVRVYRSSFEHYAVIYKDPNFFFQTGYIRLKNCKVCNYENTENKFSVTLNNYEGNALTFECRTKQESQAWICALQKNTVSVSTAKSGVPVGQSVHIPKSPPMPTLNEEDND
ncbi:hypothetical protein CHS0354_041869 [Potamilus streckersoni]|uniref:PH domain-containing protein n=1 Tax=Potamilus streckersoni TaxID=2493646 RepID=A0AAE0SSR8_9BIVA|nr:hypothetical protein CHS0354_041869 [Potamilus streckersoni]